MDEESKEVSKKKRRDRSERDRNVQSLRSFQGETKQKLNVSCVKSNLPIIEGETLTPHMPFLTLTSTPAHFNVIFQIQKGKGAEMEQLWSLQGDVTSWQL